MNAMKSNSNMNCETTMENAEKLNQHIMKDDLILLASEEKSVSKSLKRRYSCYSNKQLNPMNTYLFITHVF